MSLPPDEPLSIAEVERRLRSRGYTRTAYWKRRHGTAPPAELNPDRHLSLVRAERRYPPCVAGAWWAQPTAKARCQALLQKLDREQPLPRPPLMPPPAND